MADDPREFDPPFVSPLTHDQHARIGRIAILWGQIDMILDQLLDKALDIKPVTRMALVGERPIGAKLDILANNLGSLPSGKVRELAREFCELARQTKTQRNYCFHGVWAFRCMSKSKVIAAASHFKAMGDPVKATQLPSLEKKLCKTARMGAKAMYHLHQFSDRNCIRLFNGRGEDAPPWLAEWQEQHPLDDASLDRRWKRGQLPFLTKPL